jgi:hypothetical protein
MSRALRGRGRGSYGDSTFAQARDRVMQKAITAAAIPLFERLEDRRLLAGEARLIGISGNQGGNNPDPGTTPDEALYEIVLGEDGTTDPRYLDGFEDIVGNAPDTVVSVSSRVGVSHGGGALRVEVQPDVDAFWGVRSGNVIDLLRSGLSNLSYEMTLNNVELNGGAFGGGADNSFTGYAQSNELAIVINAPSGGFIQRNFADAGSDSIGQGAAWNGVDGTRTITWDLTRFTSNGMSIQDFINTTGATDARIWLVTQGAGDTNGSVGPMRFYFDNFELYGGVGRERFADFELLQVQHLTTLPFVPDTDAIGFNPTNGLLYHTSGAESWSNNPSSNGFRDNQFMETVDVNSPTFDKVAIFNANYEGNANGNFGLPAPRPDWVLPVERRTDAQTGGEFRIRGPNEYHAARDLAWSVEHQAFFVASEQGIYKLTADGQSTFVGNPELSSAGHAKGIAFHTFEGLTRLLVTERDGSNLWQIDPTNAAKLSSVTIRDATGTPIPGILSIVEDPASSDLLAIAKSVTAPGDAFARELIRINPFTGDSRSLGILPLHMADLAYIVYAPQVSAKEFVYETAPQRITITFNQNVQSSVSAADLEVVRLGPGGGPVEVISADYDSATNTATFNVAGGILPDGNYRATLRYQNVNNNLGMQPSADESLDFFVLNGDLNRDRSVSISDFIDLASNFGQLTTKWSDGDLNYDGIVSISDFIDLSGNFNKTLPEEGAAAAAALPVSMEPAASETVSVAEPSEDDVLQTTESESTTKKKRKANGPRKVRPQVHHRRRVSSKVLTRRA